MLDCIRDSTAAIVELSKKTTPAVESPIQSSNPSQGGSPGQFLPSHPSILQELHRPDYTNYYRAD